MDCKTAKVLCPGAANVSRLLWPRSGDAQWKVGQTEDIQVMTIIVANITIQMLSAMFGSFWQPICYLFSFF